MFTIQVAYLEQGCQNRMSMSRRGYCLDNVPMESVFGHMKDELDYKFGKT